jgi:hypothetical protein
MTKNKFLVIVYSICSFQALCIGLHLGYEDYVENLLMQVITMFEIVYLMGYISLNIVFLVMFLIAYFEGLPEK